MGFLFGKSTNTTTRAERIGDFNLNSASYGVVVPEILGTTRVSGNVIDWYDFESHEHKETQRTGKGGHHSTATSITYTYSVACVIALCEGPIHGVGKVWRDKAIYDYPNENIEMSLFNGAQGQSPWAYTQSKHPEKALPYSGLAYMAGVVNLGSSASLPTFNFEVQGKLLETGDGIDVNPADYMAHILKQAGVKTDSIEGLDSYRNYCAAADLLISTPPDTKAQKIQNIINDICEFTNAYLFWSNDRLKIVPLADDAVGDWMPDVSIKYDLTADDLLPQTDGALVIYKRKDTSEMYNQISVEFVNRANGYEKEAVQFDIVSDIQQNGLKPAPSKTCHYVYTKKRATYVAQLLTSKQLYTKNQYTFKLDWAFCRLEPGDLVTLTDDACGLTKQPVLITEVQEAADGELTVTAIGKPPRAYTPAQYNVHENDRPFQNYNEEAPSITKAMFINPPVDLQQAKNEMMVGVTAPSNWGGCNVWVSQTGDNYRQAGSIGQRARIGQLTTALSADGTECTVQLLSGELRSGTKFDADQANTALWCNGEVFSYTNAQLVGDKTYKLTGLVRGQFASIPVEHEPGDSVARMDSALLRMQYRDEDIGKTVYFKFTSLNMFGVNEQGLEDVPAYTCVIEKSYIPEVSAMSVRNRYRATSDKGRRAYEVVATFNPPANFSAYDTCECYYTDVSIPNDVEHYGGDGHNQIIVSGVELGHTYSMRFTVKDINGHYSMGKSITLKVEMKAEVPNAPEGFSYYFSDTGHFNWLEVTNADIDYYEVRSNQQAGEQDGLIARSNNTTATGVVTSRAGSLYLYAHNPDKGYSAPAIASYTIPVPPKIQHVRLRSLLMGFAFECESIPATCKGINLYIDDTVLQLTVNAVTLARDAGLYRVRAAFVDILGEGPKSDDQIVEVDETIPKEMLDGLKLSSEYLDDTLQQDLAKIPDMASKITKADDHITQIVNGLNGDPDKSGYSAITQLYNALGLKVDKDGVVSAINLSPEGVQIDGELLHVTGKTLFDNNVITNGMIQANAVTADKMKVDSLSAVSGNLGTINAGTINSVNINSANISGSHIYGGSIDGDVIRQSGYNIKSIYISTQTLEHGQYIWVPNGYNIENSIINMIGVPTFISGTNWSPSNNSTLIASYREFGDNGNYYALYREGTSFFAMGYSYYRFVGSYTKAACRGTIKILFIGG